jgi:hypothetical protein
MDKKIVIEKLKIVKKWKRLREKRKGKNPSNNNNKMYGQFGKSSGLIPLASNPCIGSYDRGFLDAPVSSQVWYYGLHREGC